MFIAQSPYWINNDFITETRDGEEMNFYLHQARNVWSLQKKMIFIFRQTKSLHRSQRIITMMKCRICVFNRFDLTHISPILLLVWRVRDAKLSLLKLWGRWICFRLSEAVEINRLCHVHREPLNHVRLIGGLRSDWINQQPDMYSMFDWHTGHEAIERSRNF